jgi:hypothetical protein
MVPQMRQHECDQLRGTEGAVTGQLAVWRELGGVWCTQGQLELLASDQAVLMACITPQIPSVPAQPNNSMGRTMSATRAMVGLVSS